MFCTKPVAYIISKPNNPSNRWCDFYKIPDQNLEAVLLAIGILGSCGKVSLDARVPDI